MTRKLTAVAPDGTVFTRRSDHPYLFAVVDRGWLPGPELARMRAELAAWRTRLVDYDARIASGRPDHVVHGSVIGSYVEYAAQARVSIERYEQGIARREQAQAAGERGAYCYATWHQRLDLAQKEMRKRAMIRTDPQIVEVK